jgi:hypothetical protein
MDFAGNVIEMRFYIYSLAATLLSVVFFCAGNAEALDKLEYYRDVQPLLTKYCVGCHNPKDSEGEFACDSFENLVKGTGDKVVLKPKAADESLFIRLIEGVDEPKMPPEDEAQPNESEKKLLRRWVEEGASVDKTSIPLRERLRVTDVHSNSQGPAPVTALLIDDERSTLIVGRYGEVTFEGLQSRKALAEIADLVGKVTSLRWSPDHSKIVIGSGVAGVGGQITLVDAMTYRVIDQWEAHQDTIYSAVLHPKGALVASSGYDRRIILHDVASKKPVRLFEGHNGAVYDLDFDPTGKLLASCSADETSKIWQVETGLRLDTLSQGEAEQYTVRFSPDGSRVLACGADRRVRAWKLLSRDREVINPMIHSLFAHEKPILWFRFSQDGKYIATAGEDLTVKIWRAFDMRPVAELGTVRDIPSDAVWNRGQTKLLLATLSGEIETFDVSDAIKNFVKAESERKSKLAGKEASDSAEDERDPDDLNDKLMTYSEVEPNNELSRAMVVSLPALIHGKVSESVASPSAIDEDWYAFDAHAGETWLIIAQAPSDVRSSMSIEDATEPDGDNDDDAAKSKQAKSSSNAEAVIDPRIEIRDASGKPVLRTRLQAVRESYFTFRGKDSFISGDFRLHRWEDMEINEYLYSGGEVVKLWLYPRGPDSGFNVYPGDGKRWTYFDTTPMSHALGEPAWIVRELAPDESPAPNGLPVFPIYYENDDDASRKAGRASKVYFNVPKDGRFFVRLRDARGLQNEAFNYELTIQKPRPDYRLISSTKELSIAPGAGGEFTISVDRIDGYQGKIDLGFEGVPEGITISQPLSIQAEQTKAVGTIFVGESFETDAKIKSISVRGVATINDKKVARQLKNPITFKVGKQQVVKTRFVAKDDVEADEISEIVIRPGQTVSTFIAVERGKEMDDVPYGKEESGRNLPHGVFIDNIGLSGLVIKPGQNTREVFITAAPSVTAQTRPFHLKATLKGNPTTKPIMLRVVTE